MPKSHANTCEAKNAWQYRYRIPELLKRQINSTNSVILDMKSTGF